MEEAGEGDADASSRTAEEQRDANEALGRTRPRLFQVRQQLCAVKVSLYCKLYDYNKLYVLRNFS